MDVDSAEWLISQATESFKQQFDAEPLGITVAPGRVNLIGEHVDYNQGLVLPFGVNRYTAVAISRRNDSQIRCFSQSRQEFRTFDGKDRPPQPWPTRDWMGYIVGTFAELFPAPQVLPGANILIQSNLPLGSGLSSSAALTTSLARNINQLWQLGLSWQELAQRCQRVEHHYLNVPCGLMDQWACLQHQPGHLLQIDFADQQIRPIPWLATDLVFLVINSGVKHQLVDGHYAERRRSCLLAAERLGVASLRETTYLPDIDNFSKLLQLLADRTLAQRAWHVISEIRRTAQAVSMIQQAKWLELGQLLNASHASLRDNYEVSCPEVDRLVAIAQNSPGVLGSRITGGGFGGATISIVPRSQVAQLTNSIVEQYREEVGIEPIAFSTDPM